MYVTILILIDGFLQCKNISIQANRNQCHNPYFNRWFSAIGKQLLGQSPEGWSQSLF